MNTFQMRQYTVSVPLRLTADDLRNDPYLALPEGLTDREVWERFAAFAAQFPGCSIVSQDKT